MNWFFGQYLERVLAKKQWNRARLAKESELTRATITHLMNGVRSDRPNEPVAFPNAQTFQKLSSALGVSVKDLKNAFLGDDPDRKENTATDKIQSLKTDWKTKYQKAESELEEMTRKYEIEHKIRIEAENRTRIAEELAQKRGKEREDMEEKMIRFMSERGLLDEARQKEES